jgi:hypothetical protein
VLINKEYSMEARARDMLSEAGKGGELVQGRFCSGHCLWSNATDLSISQD